MEGQGFRDRAPEFSAAGAEILGISFDPPEENAKFRDKYGFPFRLLSDLDHSVAEQYGALKTADEPFPDFPRRITTLIRPDGTVEATYTVSDVKAHPDEVFADLQRAAS